MTSNLDDVIESAAEVFCDSSPHGIRWADHGEPDRDIYRNRIRALAAAGLLATPPLPEWRCPACGATTRARLADLPPKPATQGQKWEAT